MTASPQSRFSNCVLIAAIAGLATGLAAPVLGADPPRGDAAITCMNPVSGASWQITIDYGKGTVDSNPARISQGEISWSNAKELGNYTLDRKSGDLTATIASSTGGYFRRARCELEHSR